MSVFLIPAKMEELALTLLTPTNVLVPGGPKVSGCRRDAWGPLPYFYLLP